MTARNIGSLGVWACMLVACAKISDGASTAAGQGGEAVRSGDGVAGSQVASGGSAGANSAGQGGRNSGTGGKSVGMAGASGGDACGRDIEVPALCRTCADGSCGAASCSAGKFIGFVCPDDADGGVAGGGGSGGVACNLACVKGKHCVANPKPTCVDDATDAGADAGSSGALHWVVSCGIPVCQGSGTYDDPNIPNCTTEEEGQACATDGQRCDGVATCGATLMCAAEAPRTCPVSRARYKQGISYLGDAERGQFHDQITQLRLASYRYKSAPDVPQLGFMIDDIEPSVAVSGDHVNLYAYLSMAVAAIQVQDQQIKGLQRQLEQLRANLATESRADQIQARADGCQVPWRCELTPRPPP
jgi:hypothetical protein